MRFEIVLAPEAAEDLRALKANVRSTVHEALETHLRHEPMKTSRSRIKRLRGLARPSIDFGSARFEYSMTYQPSPLRSWRSCPNRRRQYGWSGSESSNKRSPLI